MCGASASVPHTPTFWRRILNDKMVLIIKTWAKESGIEVKNREVLELVDKLLKKVKTNPECD